MMQPEAAAEAAAPPAAAAQGADAAAPKPPLLQMEAEAPPAQGWSRVRRVRELYVGPMSWIAAMCVLGPLVLLCPCDGREVWMGDCCGEGVADVHEDDEFDQSGTQLRPLRRDASSARVPLSEEHIWEADGPAGALLRKAPTPSEAADSPLARPLGVTARLPALRVRSRGAMMRAQRAGGSPRRTSPRRRSASGAASPPPPPRTPRGKHDWECCVCWETQSPRAPPRRRQGALSSHSDDDDTSADAGRAPPAPVLFPADAACGHGCCARCLRDYVHFISNTTALAPMTLQRSGSVGPKGVPCPGADCRTPAGWDARCHITLPPALLAALLPRSYAAVAFDMLSTLLAPLLALAARCACACRTRAMRVAAAATLLALAAALCTALLLSEAAMPTPGICAGTRRAMPALR